MRNSYQMHATRRMLRVDRHGFGSRVVEAYTNHVHVDTLSRSSKL